MNDPGYGWATRFKEKSSKSGFGCFLCTDDSLPKWHFRHRYLKTGYRTCNTFKEALFSLFYWHNESINIWSHYITATSLIFFSIKWLNLLHCDQSEFNIRFSMFILNMLGNIIPLYLSGFCHQFYCINKSWHFFSWFMDFIGLITGMFSTGISYICLAFYCKPTIAAGLLLGIFSIYLYSIYLCWKKFSLRSKPNELVPADRFPEFSQILSRFAFLSSAIPLLLTLLLSQEYLYNPIFRHIFLSSCAGPVTMALGILIFAQGNFPERFVKAWKLPDDYFDIIGHSHQFWHFCSGFLQVCWVFTLAWHLESRFQYGCDL